MRFLSSSFFICALLAAASCSSPEIKPANSCPNWSSNSIHNYQNSYFSNFGCAYYNNLQAQVTNAADLEKGHGQNTLNGDRESVNMQKYLTASPQTVTSPSTSGSTGSR